MLTQHMGILRRLSRAYTDSEEDRRDLEQEMCLQLWRSFDGFQGASKVSTWLYRVALNTALTSLRQKKVQPPLEPLPELPAPATAWDLRDQRDLLRRAMAKLPEPDRVLLLLWLEALDYAQIAEVLGVAPGTVSVRLVRAKAKLKDVVDRWESRQQGQSHPSPPMPSPRLEGRP